MEKMKNEVMVVEKKKGILERLKDKKTAIVSTLVANGIIALSTISVSADSGLAGNLSNASNGAQSEALSWVESVGVLGLVIAGVIYGIGNKQLAKTVLTCVIICYILVKFAPQLWTWFTGIF